MSTVSPCFRAGICLKTPRKGVLTVKIRTDAAATPCSSTVAQKMKAMRKKDLMAQKSRYKVILLTRSNYLKVWRARIQES
jgi:hypothetical protein